MKHQWSVPEAKMMVDSPEISIVQPREDFDIRWSRSNRYSDKAFLMNDFGHACDVCDRLWFIKGLKSPTTNHVAVLHTEFDDPNLAEFSVCNTCRRSLNSKKIPLLAKTHGFRYPPKPLGLLNLNPISERLISPRLPFMQIRRLRHEGSYGIVSQVINIPVEYFMFQMLGTYSEAIRLIFPSMNPDTETLILLCSDFNTDVTQNKSFVNFMKSRFNLDCRSSASTTLGNTCVDLTFIRNVSVQTLPYVSCVSYCTALPPSLPNY
jgi:hypothetical protein